MNYLTAIAASVLATMTSRATMKEVVDNDSQVLREVTAQLCAQSNKGEYYVLSSSAIVEEVFVPSSIEKAARRSLIDRNALSQNLPDVEPCSALLRIDQSQMSTEIQASLQTEPRRVDQWSAFYAKFPNAQGAVRLTLPGYSTTGDTAVVQVSVACGDVCKSVFYWVLRRISGHWQIHHSVAGPVS